MWKEDQHFKNLNVNPTMKMPLGSTSENITFESSSDTQNKATSKVSAVSCQ
jgi:hypothetical protein